jgi:hypothetical protein
MKAVTFLIRLSLISSAAAALGFATGRFELAAFGAATSTLLLLITARDYTPRARRWQPRLNAHQAHTSQPTVNHRFRLAA